jgi:hypothetical protein
MWRLRDEVTMADECSRAAQKLDHSGAAAGFSGFSASGGGGRG